jgi:DNA-binding SARP family transcriptional activator
VEFRVLGDLEVWHDGEALPLGAHQQRAVLAILVLHVGEVVTSDRLIDELWGDEPPAQAAKTVQVYVSRLRKALATHGGIASGEAIVTRDHGYVLRVEPEQVDARVFERLLGEARRAAADRDHERAAELLDRALGLWRGPPLADFALDAFAARDIARLEELRLEALEARIDADLELGRHAALVAELEALTAEHPLRERLCAQRMLALYRCGRQSEALAVYRQARGVLVDELGIEPSPALRELEQAILRQDQALEAPVAAEPRAPAAGERRPFARRAAVAVAAVVLCAGGLAAALALLGRGAGPITVQANSVAVIDPERNAVVGEVPVGARPGDVSAGAGGVWVANLDDDSFSKIDPRAARVVRTLWPGTSVTGSRRRAERYGPSTPRTRPSCASIPSSATWCAGSAWGQTSRPPPLPAPSRLAGTRCGPPPAARPWPGSARAPGGRNGSTSAPSRRASPSVRARRGWPTTSTTRSRASTRPAP